MVCLITLAVRLGDLGVLLLTNQDRVIVVVGDTRRQVHLLVQLSFPAVLEVPLD